MKVFNKAKRELWVSNNRVLIGSGKKVTGRNPNFDTDETRLLISLWGDPKVQKTLITTHKKHAVIARLADKMRDYGYQRSAEEINTRIKNLKCFYNRIKKDMESGTCSEPTWKHYNAMDEIMTRPIFSVRPNEIPKPSLRYKLEEAKREREERGETVDEIEEAEILKSLQSNDENGNDAANGYKNCSNEMGNDSDMENDEDENENSHEEDQNIFDDDMDYEPISSGNAAAHNVNDTPAIPLRLTRSRKNEKSKQTIEESDSACIQNINQNSIDIEEQSVIKDEPIDVDDDSNDVKPKGEDKSSDSFPFAEILKCNSAQNSSKNMSKIITTVAASLSTSSATVATPVSSPLKIGQTATLIGISSSHSVATNNPISNTQAKISLVPTNFLLKPQSQNMQQQSDIQPKQQQSTQSTIKTNTLQGLQINRQLPIRPKGAQPRIIYATQQSGSGQQTTNGIVNTSNGPMKVLLVNTLQKNSQNVQNIVTPTTTILQNKSVDMQKTTLYQTSASNMVGMKNIPQTPTVNLNGLVSSTSNEKINKLLQASASNNGKAAIGYRALLGQLVRTQDEANQISRERLQLERERFEYEKSVGGRFLNLFPGVLPNLMNLVQQPNLPKQAPLRQTILPEQTLTTQSVFLTSPIVSAVESSSFINSLNNQNIEKSTEDKEDAPAVLLTPKTEKED